MNLSDVAIRRPVFTTMMMVALMVLGTVAYRRLGVELFPDVSFPIVVVSTPYPGAGPKEVEQLVSQPIEDAVSSLGGVESVRSFSRESLSTVVVAFEIGTEINTATLDVRDRVTIARRTMPEDVEEPNYLRIDPSAAPVVTLVLSGDADPRAVRQLAEEELKPILEQADGVATVNVRGGVSREIEVRLNASALAHYMIAPAQVVGALRAENLDVPAGRLDSARSETSLRLRGQLRSVEEIGGVPVTNVGGQVVRVRDVAEVVDGQEERRTYVRVNGREAVALDIVKQAGANTVSTADAVYLAIERAQAKVPPGMALQTIVDSSVFVRENADHVLQELVLGGLAAIAVIFLFMLDWRSTLISALALPTSIVATFFAIWQLGYTLNTMTLLGLSLSIGFLIDDAIVVRENIYRHLEMGEDPVEAASKGTKEIALAVLATTASILAVFIPVAFTEGLIGRLFRQFSITVAVAVAFSLFVAFTVDPMLSARLVKPHDPHRDEYAGVLGTVRRTMEALDPMYRGVLEWSLRNPVKVVLGATVAFFGSFGLIGLMGTEFFPKPDRGQFTVGVTFAPGTSLEENLRKTQQIEQILLADPDVDLAYAVVGNQEEARKTTIRVDAGPKVERERDLVQLMETFRQQLGAIPGPTFNFQEAAIFEGDLDAREAPVAILVRGPDYAVLEDLASQVEALVVGTPGTADVTSTLTPGLPEVSLLVDRPRAEALGVSAGMLGMTLRTLMVGEEATRLREGEDDFPVRVRLREEDRQDLEALAAVPIATQRGLFPVRQFVSFQQDTGPATIEREDRQRQVSISANVVGRSLGEVVGDIQKGMDAMELPAGYTVAFGGEAERMRESGLALLAALVLAIIFIYVVLASQFESFLHPITIMMSLPLAVVGAFLGLFLAGKVLGMSAFIGVILLMGLVTKNAILLVDYANQLRDEQGLDLEAAMLIAGPTRLRPILMTSATIVLGSLPTALSTGPGSEFRAPMSIAVIGGVITSTLLTLLVVPVVYRSLDRFTARGRADRARTADAAPTVTG